jgi:hypothetical protein
MVTKTRQDATCHAKARSKCLSAASCGMHRRER